MYTDPQIHSIDGKGYGVGNLGMRGIMTFLESHTCNQARNMGDRGLEGGGGLDQEFHSVAHAFDQIKILDPVRRI